VVFCDPVYTNRFGVIVKKTGRLGVCFVVYDPVYTNRMRVDGRTGEVQSAVRLGNRKAAGVQARRARDLYI